MTTYLPDLKLEILLKILQTDKKKKNVLTFTRDAVFPFEEEIIKKYSSMLDENKPFYMEAGYLLHNLFDEVREQLCDVDVSKLEGTE